MCCQNLEPIMKMFTVAFCIFHARRQFQQNTPVYCHSNHYIGLHKPTELQEFEAPIISRQSAHKYDKVVGPTRQPP